MTATTRPATKSSMASVPSLQLVPADRSGPDDGLVIAIATSAGTMTVACPVYSATKTTPVSGTAATAQHACRPDDDEQRQFLAAHCVGEETTDDRAGRHQRDEQSADAATHDRNRRADGRNRKTPTSTITAWSGSIAQSMSLLPDPSASGSPVRPRPIA